MALPDFYFADCFFDSKRINRAFFGAFYEEDIYDRACTALPLLARGLWWRVPEGMRDRKLIFVHVPRAGGTSVVRALFGTACIHHYSMRYFQAIHPRLADEAESFAILRDPLERFASAYSFVRRGGSDHSRLSQVFVAQTRNIRSVDDYLSFLEDREAVDLDFVMRPQSWFVCDHARSVLVKRLFLCGDDSLTAFLRRYGIEVLPWLNRTERFDLSLTRRQITRVENLYAEDFALVEALRNSRPSLPAEIASVQAAMRVAAE